MTRKILIALSATALLAACNQNDHGATAQPDAAATETKKLMVEIVDPQAKVLWGVAGHISDESGDHALRPTTEEGWKAAEDAATVLAEAGRKMLTSPYVDGRGEDWKAFARGLTELAERNRKGVVDRLSDDELLDLGNHLYNVCSACHEAYLPEDAPPEA
jgi:hypothetical protein